MVTSRKRWRCHTTTRPIASSPHSSAPSQSSTFKRSNLNGIHPSWSVVLRFPRSLISSDSQMWKPSSATGPVNLAWAQPHRAMSRLPWGCTYRAPPLSLFRYPHHSHSPLPPLHVRLHFRMTSPTTHQHALRRKTAHKTSYMPV